MRPARAPAEPFGPQKLMSYPYSRSRPALGGMAAAGRPDPHDGHRLEFVHPATGRSVMNTISAFVQLVPAGFETRVSQSTDGGVYVVVEGEGEIKIGDQTFAVGGSDILVIPAWAKRRFRGSSELVLFSFSDRAAQERLGLWRERLD